MASCDLCQRQILALTALAEEACWCSRLLVLVTLLLLLINCFQEACTTITDGDEIRYIKGIHRKLELERACDEIYVVGEGETLDSISDKCGDPFIVEHNPHIHVPDDIFPGFVMKITPAKSRKSLN